MVPMGRLMDRVMSGVNGRDPRAATLAEREVKRIAPICRWTDGEWEDLNGLAWNEVENVPRRSVGAIALRVLLPAVTFVVLIGLWWLATIVFGWPSYIVPTPLEVWNEMSDQRSLLASNFRTTLWEALLGFGLAIAIAVPCAVAIAYSRVLELTVYPALVALNAIPKIAIAPLLVIWMGFGAGPKIVMVVLICFFPIVISTATGLKSTPAEITELSQRFELSPLLMGWTVAALMRIATGSATVAMSTAAGIVAPIALAAGYPHPELLVLATGAGSLILSHVNDGGFWLIKEYFNMSVAQTFKTWTVLETLVSLVALALTALLATVLGA